MTLDSASFSSPVALATGSHTVTLRIQGAAGNEATQTWQVNVILDTHAPVLSGISVSNNVGNTVTAKYEVKVK